MNNDVLIIQGLAGKKTLSGEVAINGAKNAVLKAMAATILFKDTVRLENVPMNEDVKKMIIILERMGAKIVIGESSLSIDPTGIKESNLDQELAQSMRASVVLTGPLLARFGNVKFPAPGGCVIGARPIDLFVEGYRKMGANIDIVDEMYSMEINGKLKSTEIFFNLQTVGGTETLMMAATLGQGKIVLKNCAMEPEIVSVAEYLNSCGANIKGAGTPTIEIMGGNLLESKGRPYITVPDRIEAGSFLLLGALCADNLKISKCIPEHLYSTINLLKESGVPIVVNNDSIEIKNNGDIKNSSFKSFNVRTHEYPGFPTDLQAPMVTFLTQVGGESIVLETIYEGRFKFIKNLISLGANITSLNAREILIKGNTNFNNTDNDVLDAFDIRAGFATIIAGIVSNGQTRIKNTYYIDRGYENIVSRLNAIGANISRQTN